MAPGEMKEEIAVAQGTAPLPDLLILEAKAQLKLNHSTGQAIRCTAKAIRINDVRGRSSWNEILKIQDVKRIKEVGAKIQLGRLAEEAGMRERKYLVY